MKTLRILCQYIVLLVCVAACGLMVLCLGVGAFFGWTWKWWNQVWDDLEKQLREEITYR